MKKKYFRFKKITSHFLLQNIATLEEKYWEDRGGHTWGEGYLMKFSKSQYYTKKNNSRQVNFKQDNSIQDKYARNNS